MSIANVTVELVSHFAHVPSRADVKAKPVLACTVSAIRSSLKKTPRVYWPTCP